MTQAAAYTKKISAVICTYNRYPLLEKAIESTLNQTMPSTDYEVIIVDNSPTNREMAQQQAKWNGHPVVRYLIEETPGLSNARNVAARVAQSPYVAYLDDDAIADPNWIVSVYNAFEQFGEKVGIVGGQIDPIWEIPKPDWLPDEMLGMLTVVNWGGSARIAEPNEWAAGANIAFRVSALNQVGGFNVSLGRTGSGSVLLSNEESAVVEKLKELGYQLVYAPEARVDHLVEKKRLEPAWLRRRQAWQAVSDYLKTPEMFKDKEEAYWGVVARYFSKVPPRQRTVAGLFSDLEDEDLFGDQVRATYCMVGLLLMGGSDFDQLRLEV